MSFHHFHCLVLAAGFALSASASPFDHCRAIFTLAKHAMTRTDVWQEYNKGFATPHYEAKPLTVEHIGIIRDLYDDPDVLAWDPMSEKVRLRAIDILERTVRGTDPMAPILKRGVLGIFIKGSAQPIGILQAFGYLPGVEIGIGAHLLPEYWDQGILSEIFPYRIEHLARSFEIKQLSADAAATNVRSLHLLKNSASKKPLDIEFLEVT